MTSPLTPMLNQVESDAALRHWEQLLKTGCSCVAGDTSSSIEAIVHFQPYGGLSRAYRYQLVTRAFNLAADHAVLAKIDPDDAKGLAVRLVRAESTATRATIRLAYVAKPHRHLLARLSRSQMPEVTQ